MPNLDTTKLDIAKFNMIEQQIRPCEVNNPLVIDALNSVNRHEFVPEMYQNLAYADCQIPFADKQTMMKPVVEGKILQALNIQPKEMCLEVGTGTGYFTACLAALAKEVHSIDINEDIIEKAKQALSEYKNISLECGNAFERLGAGRTFDVIAVTSAANEIPENFKLALNDGGRLFIIQNDANSPIMHAMLVTRLTYNEWTTTTLFETEINQLIN